MANRSTIILEHSELVNMVSRILVALDDTAHAQTLLNQAMAMAEKFSAQLLLLSVLSPIDLQPLGLQPGGLGIEGFFPILNEQSLQQYSKEWQAYASQKLTQLQQRQQQALDRGIGAECQQTEGDPGARICEIAAAWDADMIITGRNRRSGLSELFLGSTSNYVLHHAPCSVWVIQATTGTASAPPDAVAANV